MVCIHYRENATCQGTIQWLDEEKTQTFRSFLEMMQLMQEALEKNSPGNTFHSWKNEGENPPHIEEQREGEVLALLGKGSRYNLGRGAGPPAKRGNAGEHGEISSALPLNLLLVLF